MNKYQILPSENESSDDSANILSMLPPDVFAEIISHMPKDSDDAAVLARTTPILSNHPVIKQAVRNKNIIPVTNTIIELYSDLQTQLQDLHQDRGNWENGVESTEALGAFFIALSSLNDHLNILKKHAGDRAETWLKEAFDNRSIPLPDNTVFSELNTSYENKYQNRRDHLDVVTIGQMIVKSINASVSMVSGMATAMTSVYWGPLLFGMAVGLPIVGIGTAAGIGVVILFAGSAYAGYKIADAQNKSALKEHYLTCQGLLDNLEGLTEIFREEAPSINQEPVKKEHAEEIKALLMDKAFEQSNSTGIQKIRRAIEQRPFMSGDCLLDLIQSTFKARNNQAKIPGFFCKLNRADDIQDLYDLTNDANFDLSVNAEDRTALIERLTSIVENPADALDEETPDEETPLLNNLMIQ